MRSRWIVALFVLFGVAGCRSCTRRECEPYELVAHCEGNRLVYCAEEGSSYGINFGTRKVNVACGPKDVCIDDHHGAADCVHAPVTRCEEDPKSSGTCEGNTVLVCMSPSIRTSEKYIVSARECFSFERCVMGEFGARCESVDAGKK